MLTDTPCKRVSVPKGEKKEKDICTLEEVAQLFQLLETAPLKYRTFFTLAIYSGFRHGEMLGLEWKGIDWEDCVISVRRTSNYTASKGISTDTTKTKKSQRSLKFPQCVMDLLREYKAEQDEERVTLGTKWQDYDRLFVKWDGRPMNTGCSQRTQDSRIDHYLKQLSAITIKYLYNLIVKGSARHLMSAEPFIRIL